MFIIQIRELRKFFLSNSDNKLRKQLFRWILSVLATQTKVTDPLLYHYREFHYDTRRLKNSQQSQFLPDYCRLKNLPPHTILINFSPFAYLFYELPTSLLRVYASSLSAVWYKHPVNDKWRIRRVTYCYFYYYYLHYFYLSISSMLRIFIHPFFISHRDKFRMNKRVKTKAITVTGRGGL
jgi:hypothetical protein